MSRIKCGQSSVGTSKPESQMVTFSPFSTPPKTVDIGGVAVQVAPGVETAETKTIEINGWLGIYQVEGDELKICLAPPLKDRPKELKAPSGSGLTLTIYKRVKKVDEKAAAP